MKFMVLLTEPDHFDRWEALGPAERERDVAAFQAFDAAVKQRGTVVAGEALDRTETARTVRAAEPGTQRVVVDGPYAESVEQLGGFYVIDVPDLAIACELAGLLPSQYSLEVRPVVDVDLS